MNPLILLLLLLPAYSAYSITNNLLQDLAYSDIYNLKSDAASWVVSNKVCSDNCDPISFISGSCPTGSSSEPYSYAYQQYLLGGPNILGPSEAITFNQYFERQYPLGPNTYNVLAIQVQVSIVAQNLPAYDINNMIGFSVNGVDFSPSNTGWTSPCSVVYSVYSPVTNTTDTYSASLFISYVQTLVSFPPSNTATLRFTSRLFEPSKTSSFGLKSISIHLMDTKNEGTYNYPCAINYYWNTTTCAPCHQFCSTCSGTEYTQCSACTSPNYYYGNGTCFNSCPSSGPLAAASSSGINTCYYRCPGAYYWAYNDTCASTCSFPYVSTTGLNNVAYCNSHCTSAQFLYPDGTCHGSCPALLVNETLAETLKYCKSPCGSFSPFLYTNGTCSVDCPSPLPNKTEYGVLYCYYPCSENEYLHANGTCLGSCSSPLVIVKEGNFTFCRNPCDSSSFLYPNSTCSVDCSLPWRSKEEYGVKYCKTPCLGNQYLYPSESCVDSCPSPLVPQVLSATLKYCRNPCDSQLFLYPNGTCNNSCQFPLSNKTEYGILRCYSACSENEYLYANGTCLGNCSSPLVIVQEGNFTFCRNPCDPNGSMPFLYPDSSCNNTCPAPLFNRTEPGATYCFNHCVRNNTFLHENLLVCQATCSYPSITTEDTYEKYCHFPCEDQNQYFQMLDKKCEETCEYPYQAIESPLPKLCSSSLSQEEIKQIQKMAGATNSANSAASTGNLIWSLISSGDSTAAMMGPLAKMLQYIKFMDIAFPEKVQFMLLEQTKKANKKGFSSKMLGSALDRYPNHEVTDNFRFYSIKSSFFANYWPVFFNVSVIFVVTLLVMLAETQTKRNPKINGILKSLSDVLKWNVFLTTFCGSIGDIVLYTALELQTMQFENAEAVFSFILCLGMNALAVIVVVKILDVNSAIRQSKKKTRNEEEFQKMIAQEFNSYKALFECYKDYSFYQQIFLFVFIMRLVLFNASIGYFYKYPLFQAVTSLVTNTLMLLYLVIKRPMRKIITLIQQIVLELVLLPFNVCVLTLAVMDNQEILDVDRRKSIGNVIFYINVMLPVLSVILMAAKFIAMAVDMYKTWRMSKLKKPVTTQAKLRNQPMSVESSQNNSSTTQIFDLNDHSIILSPEVPEVKRMRPNSKIDSSVYPRMRHSRPLNNNNFLPPNMVRNSPFPSHQNAFSQQQDLGIRADYQAGRSRERVQRRRNRSGRLKLQDNELIW